MERIYISCPMEFNPNHVNDIETAKKYYEKQGFNVITPLDVAKNLRAVWTDKTCQPQYGDYLAYDLYYIARSGVNKIVLLPNWQYSKGCTVEVIVAKILGLELIEHTIQTTINKPITKVMRQKAAMLALLVMYHDKAKTMTGADFNSEIDAILREIDDLSILCEREQELMAAQL